MPRYCHYLTNPQGVAYQRPRSYRTINRGLYRPWGQGSGQKRRSTFVSLPQPLFLDLNATKRTTLGPTGIVPDMSGLASHLDSSGCFLTPYERFCLPPSRFHASGLRKWSHLYLALYPEGVGSVKRRAKSATACGRHQGYDVPLRKSPSLAVWRVSTSNSSFAAVCFCCFQFRVV